MITIAVASDGSTTVTLPPGLNADPAYTFSNGGIFNNGSSPIVLTAQGLTSHDGAAAQELDGIKPGPSGYTIKVWDFGDAFAGLNYSTFGQWAVELLPDEYGLNGWYAAGTPTPLSGTGAMPTSGSAIYQGKADAVFVSGQIGYYPFTGTATINASFGGAGSVTGGVTNLVPAPGWPPNPNINQISFIGGTISGNNFSGTATLGPNPPPYYYSQLTGSFQGNFYGPGAAEAAGTFNLSTPGGSTALNIAGSFGAKR